MRKVLVRSAASWFEDDLDNYDSLRELLEIVDDWIGYTQANVTVEDAATEKLIAIRQWFEPMDGINNPMLIGAGYYDHWKNSEGELILDTME